MLSDDVTQGDAQRQNLCCPSILCLHDHAEVRGVRLKGEAHFEVAEEPHWPLRSKSCERCRRRDVGTYHSM